MKKIFLILLIFITQTIYSQSFNISFNNVEFFSKYNSTICSYTINDITEFALSLETLSDNDIILYLGDKKETIYLLNQLIEILDSNNKNVYYYTYHSNSFNLETNYLLMYDNDKSFEKIDIYKEGIQECAPLYKNNIYLILNYIKNIK